VYTFGGITTDYMLDIDYDKENGGWGAPKIVQNAPFELDPANATLHYAIECFEGAKAYRTVDDRIIMFRCDENFKRMNNSHKQLGIPLFDVEQMTECCRKLIEVEKDWIPNKPMHSLYIRPTSICMDNKLGLGRVTKAKTFIILSPVGPYYPRGFVPVKLFCSDGVIRAWPNGFGDKKVGG
jgi:branched-chain amino acid aminotransferase